MKNTNNKYIHDAAKPDNKNEERRRKDERRLLRGEAKKLIKKDPKKLIFIALLFTAFVIVSLILGKILTTSINQLIHTSFFSGMVRFILYLFVEAIDMPDVNKIIESLINSNVNLYAKIILYMLILIIFFRALWIKMLPWIGKPDMDKSEKEEIENDLALAFDLDESDKNYHKRPFIISYDASIEGSSVEQYVFWSGYSIDKWNNPDIKSEILTALGGELAEEMKNRKSTKSTKKLKEDKNIIIVRIIPGAGIVKKYGLEDDEL